MTNTDEALPVHIYLLLDRTGSMEEIRGEVISGFNQFLIEQQAVSGECRMTLVQFDRQAPFEILHAAADITEVDPLTSETFVPRGLTPLIDAECQLIELAEVRASARAKARDEAEAIIFVTFTDGIENCSHLFTFDQLKELKMAHENEWAFIYLGMGHDAYNQATQVGTLLRNTGSYNRDPGGVGEAYASASAETVNVRERAAQGLHTNSSETIGTQE